MVKMKEKRGFTLVELIVVLVILAILAALLVPALTGYIDKAKKSQVIAETRMLHTAIQTEMSELYGKSNIIKETTDVKSTFLATKTATPNGSTETVTRYQTIVKLSEVPSLQEGGNGRFGAYISPSGKVAFILYYDGKGYVGIYFSETQEYIALSVDEAPYYEYYLLGDSVQISNEYKNLPTMDKDSLFGRDRLMKLITGKVT